MYSDTRSSLSHSAARMGHRILSICESESYVVTWPSKESLNLWVLIDLHWVLLLRLW